jgi:hypothetical protein
MIDKLWGSLATPVSDVVFLAEHIWPDFPELHPAVSVEAAHYFPSLLCGMINS